MMMAVARAAAMETVAVMAAVAEAAVAAAVWRRWARWWRCRWLWGWWEGSGHVCGGADDGGLEGLDEEQAAVVGLVAGAAGSELGDVERREERVDVLA